MHYAMVVVVEAKDEDAAHRGLTHALAPVVTEFVGEPWEVKRESANFDGDFDTLGCFDQHPDA